MFAAPNRDFDAERRIRKAIGEAGVRVWRAPKGVERARENGTGLEGRFVDSSLVCLWFWGMLIFCG